jgi:hypothetical protein
LDEFLGRKNNKIWGKNKWGAPTLPPGGRFFMFFSGEKWKNA